MMIDKNDMDNLIEQKRNEVRNERNVARPDSTDQNGTGLVRYRESSNGTVRPGVQLAPSSDRQSETNYRGTEGGDARERDPQRVSEEKPVRERPGRRRLGSIDTRKPDTEQESGGSSRAIDHGGIERIDGEFFRPDLAEKKDEKKKTENIVSKLINKLPDTSEDLPFIGSRGKTKVFSKTEAKEQYEPLKQAISDYGDYLDIYMQRIEPDHPDTWGNFSEKELDIVTRALLKRAQSDPKAASFTRLMIDGQDYIGAFVILVPRVSITLQFVGRRIPKRGRKQA
jgi:hypothetical protein